MSESLIFLDQEFYKQYDGVAMVSPLGPTLANVFLCYHEKIWLQIVLLNLNVLSIEGKLMIHSYFLARNISFKNSKLFKLST